MLRALQQLRDLIERRAHYPLALQGVVALVLLLTPLSGVSLHAPFSMADAPQRYWAMTAMIGLHLIATLSVPARKLSLWLQLLYLTIQCGLAAVAQALFPAPLFDYVYLAIVLQSLVLFRPWIWILFAIGVWALWSGGVIMATASALSWLQSNLVLAFPATCAIIAAITYLRQHSRSEQAQQMLQQMQQRYDSLSTALREIQQRVALEERRRLAQQFTGEVQIALARTEQSIASALNQAQSNLSWLQTTISQTRDSAGAAIERLRGAITILRHSEDLPRAPRRLATVLPITEPFDELVISSQPYRILSWVLPIIFITLSLPITLTMHPPAVDVIMPLMALYALLLLAYIYTQRARNPLLLQIGLAGQTLAVTALAAITQPLPILLGLLLVLWQIALRLPLGQILLFLAGVPLVIGLLLARMRPLALDSESLLICAVAAVSVTGPLLLARRQLENRHQAELRAALLASEIEQQTEDEQTSAIAAERSRLAREFHDDLGSRLMLINLQLQLAEDLIADSSEEALAQLQASREQLRAAWHSVLAVADAEIPLSGSTIGAALADLVGQCRLSAAVAVDLHTDAGLESLSPTIACTIYRAVQEGVANACKHAHPRLISVQIELPPDQVRVTITNDARPGVAPLARSREDSATRISYGLIGLRERAEALGGDCESGPTAEGGFCLTMRLPAERMSDG
ncbi:MAG: two-component sensor histidine kinase [Oscillochloris sp.]|nr:two-component sensor histidine kinase [Oscillochloris sp.]